MTFAGSGRSTPVSFARFNPDGSLSRTYRDSSVQASLLGTHYERWSGTWPRSGMCRDGIVYELPMSARPTAESGSSSSLNVPTPTASDAHWSNTEASRSGIVGNHNLSLVEWSRQLLPTPDATHGRKDSRTSRMLPGVVDDLLPTPIADHSRGLAQTGTDFQSLPNTVLNLLPTPDTMGNITRSAEDLETGHAVSLPRRIESLLPTPRTPSGRGQKVTPRKRTNGAGPNLEDSLGALTQPPSEDGSE